MDEMTFLFWEEAILSERIRDRGLTEWYVPSIQIYHKWSRSVGQGGLEHLIRSTVYYFRTYRRTGLPGVFILKLNLLIMAGYRILRGVEPRRWSSAARFWRVVLEA
jgi:GT2 family glycosyltransferase